MFLQRKQPEELQQLLEAITDSMEMATSTADHRTAREGLLHRVERLRESLGVPGPADGCMVAGKTANATKKLELDC